MYNLIHMLLQALSYRSLAYRQINLLYIYNAISRYSSDYTYEVRRSRLASLQLDLCYAACVNPISYSLDQLVSCTACIV